MRLGWHDGAVRGIDEANVTAWMAEHVGAAPPLTYELIAGGRSNLTYAVTDAAGRRMVLRRPPLGHVLATAHDVAREHRIISALVPTPVPVAPTLGLCEDPAVNEAPFYVMDFVDGVVVDTPQKGDALTQEVRDALAFDLVDVLADLHAVDVAEVGLDTLARHGGYVERQLKRWTAQWEASKTREVPAIDEVRDRLAADIPPQQRVSIAHGDYRLGNCMSDPEAGRIKAVLDWELCTLGDPLADLGFLGLWWADLEGFGPFERLVERYAATTGLDVSRLPYYVALAAFRLAVIGEGVYRRYLEGVMGDEDVDLEFMKAGVADRAERALAALKAGG